MGARSLDRAGAAQSRGVVKELLAQRPVVELVATYLDNPSLTENERVLIRCRVAADFIHRGQYEAAREALGGLWQGVGQRPPVSELPPDVDAEVLLQCGTL